MTAEQEPTPPIFDHVGRLSGLLMTCGMLSIPIWLFLRIARIASEPTLRWMAFGMVSCFCLGLPLMAASLDKSFKDVQIWPFFVPVVYLLALTDMPVVTPIAKALVRFLFRDSYPY